MKNESPLSPDTSSYSFFVEADGHALHARLLDVMLKAAAVSSDIEVIQQNITGYNFCIRRGAEALPIVVRGLAGAHEFTPLLYSLLNAEESAGKPDVGLGQRIRNLPGPIRVTTYVSLFCKESPKVVQSLSWMALIHSDFHHEIVEQTLFLDEFAERNIRVLPSVFIGDRVFHSGPATLEELLCKLESLLGQQVGECAERIRL